MKLFNLSLILNGFPIKKVTKLLKEIHQKTDSEFESYLETIKKEIVKYHLEHNSFYRDLVSGIDISNWDNIPVMTKRDLQKPLEERLSGGYTTKNIYVNKTSGSSGDPFIFAKDKYSHALTWAVIQNRFGWFNLDFNASKQARFYGIPLGKKGYYKERFKDALSKRFRFSVFDLSDKAFKNILKNLKLQSLTILMVIQVLLFSLQNIWIKKTLL